MNTTEDSSGHNFVEEFGFLHAFFASFAIIIVSELGDKTFFIAAIMAMRDSRVTVFAGAISALGLMTVLASLFGYAAMVIPKVITYYVSTALFAVFGVKMLYDAYQMRPEDATEDFDQVQVELDAKNNEDKENTDIENQPESQQQEIPSLPFHHCPKLRRVLFAIFSRVYLQAFSMTFLAEWGDRSQIATIILAAREDVIGVCVGGILGHSCCTGLAVLGGHAIATKISVRNVTVIGAVIFLVFSVTSLFFNPYQ